MGMDMYAALLGRASSGGGGGGSGLPSVTGEDIGKALKVVAGTASTTNITPEQEVTVSDNPVELSNANPALFTERSEIRLTVNGVPYTAYVSTHEGNNDIYITTENSYYAVYSQEGSLWFISDAGTYTVSLDKITHAGEWGSAPAYDLAIALNSNNLSEVTDATIIAGSFQSVFSKANMGIPYFVGVFDEMWGSMFGIYTVSVAPDGIGIDILQIGSPASAYVASSSGGSPTKNVLIPNVSYASLNVYPNGSITGWWE